MHGQPQRNKRGAGKCERRQPQQKTGKITLSFRNSDSRATQSPRSVSFALMFFFHFFLSFGFLWIHKIYCGVPPSKFDSLTQSKMQWNKPNDKWSTLWLGLVSSHLRCLCSHHQMHFYCSNFRIVLCFSSALEFLFYYRHFILFFARINLFVLHARLETKTSKESENKLANGH